MTKTAFLTASALLCSMQAFTANPVHAAAGALDPSFGRVGQVTISFPNNNVIVEDGVLQPDGKMVLAAVARLLSDTIDSDPFPLSPRVQTLKGILAKIRPEPVRQALAPPKVYARPGAGAGDEIFSGPAMALGTAAVARKARRSRRGASRLA